MRPSPRQLSLYYVTIALGGLLGGIGNALIAPVVFDRIIEYPLALILASLIVPWSNTDLARQSSNTWLRDSLFAGIVFGVTLALVTNQGGLGDSALGAIGVTLASGLGVLSCVTARRRPIRFALVIAGVLAAGGLTPGVNGRLLHIERDFFGVLRVTHDSEHNTNRLFHGSTLHGEQSLKPALSREPLTYFTRSGPIGQVFRVTEARWNRPHTQIAIVGLGVGTLATYAQPGQHWTGPWNGLPAIHGFSPIYEIAAPMPSMSFWAMPGNASRVRPMGLINSSCSMPSAPTRCLCTCCRARRSGSTAPSSPRRAYCYST
jgi:hypothetical protein